MFKIMNIEEIDEWLDNEYGVSYTRLEKLHDFVIDQDLKHQENAEKEIKQLKSSLEAISQSLSKQTTKVVLLKSENIRLNNIIRIARNLVKEYKECLEKGADKGADYIYISSLCNKLEELELLLEGEK